MVDLLSKLVGMLSNVRHLSLPNASGDYESTEWLPLLRLFSAVEVLEVCGELAEYIAAALDDIAEEMVTVLLPALQLLCLVDDNEKRPLGSTERFRSLRQLSCRPVTIVTTQDEFVERLNAHHWRKEKVP